MGGGSDMVQQRPPSIFLSCGALGWTNRKERRIAAEHDGGLDAREVAGEVTFLEAGMLWGGVIAAGDGQFDGVAGLEAGDGHVQAFLLRGDFAALIDGVIVLGLPWATVLPSPSRTISLLT